MNDKYIINTFNPQPCHLNKNRTFPNIGTSLPFNVSDTKIEQNNKRSISTQTNNLDVLRIHKCSICLMLYHCPRQTFLFSNCTNICCSYKCHIQLLHNSR